MRSEQFGVAVDDFRLPIREALRKASELKFGAVEVGAAKGPVTPDHLSAGARRHFLRFTHDLGLNLVALSADMPRLRLTDPATVQERVERTRAVLELACHLRTPVVTAHVSALTDPQTGQPFPQAVEALRQIALDADRTGSIYALRPSDDRPEDVANLLQEIGCPSLRLCLDPASMVMRGRNPADLVSKRPADVVLSHLRDGTAGRPDGAGHETTLGDGDVDLWGYLMLLEASDYHGAHILRRCDSQTPVQDILQGRKFIEREIPSF